MLSKTLARRNSLLIFFLFIQRLAQNFFTISAPIRQKLATKIQILEIKLEMHGESWDWNKGSNHENKILKDAKPLII